VVKFVPASGAASRMFKNMFAFVDADYDVPTTDFEKKYFDSIEKFAFYDALDTVCQKNEGKGIKQLIADGNYTDCLKQADVLLTTDELPSNPMKQFFIPMVPLAGTDGEFIVMRTIYRLLCRYGNKGGIAYA